MRKIFLFVSLFCILCFCQQFVHCKITLSETDNTTNTKKNQKIPAAKSSSDKTNNSSANSKTNPAQPTTEDKIEVGDTIAKTATPPIDFDETGEVQIFLPFKEKTTDTKDVFATISAYLILVQLGYNAATDSDKVGIVVVNKAFPDKPIVAPNYAMKVLIRKEEGREGVVANIQGISVNDKEMTILGFAKEVFTPEDAVPGQEVLKFSPAIDAGPDVIVNIDVETQEIKRNDKSVSDAKFRKRLEEQRKQKILAREEELKKEEQLAKETYKKREDAKNPAELKVFKNISEYKKDLEFVKTVGGFSGGENTPDLCVKDKYVYFTTGASQTLEIFDISNFDFIQPATSFYIKKYTQDPNIRDIRSFYSYFHKVKIVNKYAYIIDSGSGVTDDLLILDISSATSPKLLTSYNTKDEPFSIEVYNNYVYLVTQKDFQIVDVSNLKELKLINSYNLDLETDTYVFSMVVNKNYVYIGGFKTGLITLDISNPKKIEIVSRMKSENWVIPLEVYDNNLFVSNWDLKGSPPSNINIYNLKNSASPQLITTISLKNSEGVISSLIQQDKLYIGLLPLPIEIAFSEPKINSLKVFDISNISNPVLIDAFASERKCLFSSLHKQEKYLYAGSINFCPVIILQDSK